MALSVAARWKAWILLGAVAVTSLLLNLWGLSANGYGNIYYAAAVRSMTESWHNFFFVAFDPGGFISVDKPPVFLWVDTASARLFGYSSGALLIPSTIAGTACAILTWYVTKRYFGVTAATVAALVLVLTPIVTVTNRLNMPEPFYILALAGAAACVMRSLEGERWWTWTVAAGLLVGVAFNTKMLAAWIPGPALVAAIVLGVEGPWRQAWRRWLPQAAVLGSVTLVASVSWMVVVDSWPKDSRPFVGGSTDNSVLDLALGYNGFGRLEGEETISQPAPATAPDEVISETLRDGDPGILRMFDEPVSRQIGWFLPLALIGGLMSLWRWRNQPLLRAFVALWLAWAVLFGAAFSFTNGVFHSYYTAALAPAVAVLVGLGLVAPAQLIERHRGWLLPAVAAVVLTAWVQMEISGTTPDFYAWLRPLMLAFVLAGLGMFALSAWRPRLPSALGFLVAVVGLSLMPGVWSGYEAAHQVDDPFHAKAILREENPFDFVTGPASATETAALAAFLTAEADENSRWDLVVENARYAAVLRVNTRLSVLPLGGYLGDDPAITVEEFAELVASGEVRFVYPLIGPGVPGRRPPSQSHASDVFVAVRAVCNPTTDLISPILKQFFDFLYDCAGKAEELSTR